MAKSKIKIIKRIDSIEEFEKIARTVKFNKKIDPHAIEEEY